MTSKTCDTTLVIDPRFAGGTAQAFRTDLLALRAAGLKVGLRFFRTGGFFGDQQPENPDLLELRDLEGVEINPERSESTFLHNPQIFGARQLAHAEVPLELPATDRLFMVTHHPPFAGDGALFYDPLSSQRALSALSPNGNAVEWLPISGLVRSQLRSFAPLVSVSPVDWVNTFDVADWTPQREKLRGAQITIGRHGRAHPNKWPDRPQDIAASLPASPDQKIKVLGAEPEFFRERGVDTSGWELLAFGALPPREFLDDLDIFSYFHSAQWREAFGRTIAEAMMMGLRCMLDPELRPTFGPRAIYCNPGDVPELVARIRENPAEHRKAATAAGNWCRSEFAADDLHARYQELMESQSRHFLLRDRAVPPHVALRKWIGFHRRARMSA